MAKYFKKFAEICVLRVLYKYNTSNMSVHSGAFLGPIIWIQENNLKKLNSIK